MGISQLGPKMATSCRHGIKRVLSYLHTKRLRNTNTFKGMLTWDCVRDIHLPVGQQLVTANDVYSALLLRCCSVVLLCQS